jgi:hypothetical protein
LTSGASKHAYLAVFYYIGFGLIVTEIAKGPGPDNKTDLVEPICPFINMDISVLNISVLDYRYKTDIE